MSSYPYQHIQKRERENRKQELNQSCTYCPSGQQTGMERTVCNVEVNVLLFILFYVCKQFIMLYVRACVSFLSINL